MTYELLKKKLCEYNWDDGFEIPRKILSDSECDLALALDVFSLADGETYLYCKFDNHEIPDDSEWYEFICKLYSDIINNKYPKTQNQRQFSEPATRTYKYTMKKMGVPPIFWEE